MIRLPSVYATRMTTDTSSMIKGLVTVFGCFLIHLTIGTSYSLGNMSPYLVSYIHAKHPGSSIRPADMSWIFAFATGLQGVGMWIGGTIENITGHRAVIALGCFIATSSWIAAFLVIDSYPGQLLTLGFWNGLGCGIAYGTPLRCGMQWFPQNKGIVNGIILSGFGGSAFIFNQIQTALINPMNEEVEKGHNAQHPEDALFSASSHVIRNIPHSMLLLATILYGMQILGLVLIQTPPSEDEIHPLATRLMGNAEAKPCQPYSLTVKQALRTRTFWLMFLMMFFNNQMCVFASTLYKVYGQDRELSDKHLATAGALAALGNASGRLAWGALTDRLGFRRTMACLQCVLIFFTCTWTLTDSNAPGTFGAQNISPQANEILFTVWVCVIFFCIGGNFAIFPTGAAVAFGPQNLSSIYGLVFMACSVSNLIGVVLSSQLQDALGWGLLTVVVASLIAAGLVVNSFLRIQPPQPSGSDEDLTI